MADIQCCECGSSDIKAHVVLGDCLGARCTGCGGKIVVHLVEGPWSQRQILDTIDQFFTDWPDQKEVVRDRCAKNGCRNNAMPLSRHCWFHQ